MPFSKEITTIASVALPIHEKWQIRRCRFTSGLPGPRLCITSGIHGDETVGQMVLYTLSSQIQNHPEALTGTVDLYPMLNPLGLDLNERMVPMNTWLDMNRAFPGSPDGTPMENMCWSILEDLKGADLVLDLHASANEKNELFEVRLNYDAQALIPKAQALHPEVIWVYPDRPSFDSSLTGALTRAGTDAMILEADERSFEPSLLADRIVDGLFSVMHSMGLWSEPPKAAGSTSIPIIYSGVNVERITCSHAGIFVPRHQLGQTVTAGTSLGKIIDALQGSVLQEVTAPCDGLIFTQRSYSAVYPGTLLARIRKEAEA